MASTQGHPMYATFKGASTLSTQFAALYISASNTVAEVTTATQFAIGTLDEKMSGGSGTAAKVNLFGPLRKLVAGASVTAGLQIGLVTATARFQDALTGTGTYGVAVTGATVAGEYFSAVILPTNNLA